MAETYSLFCPGCHKDIEVSADCLGGKVECSLCGKKFKADLALDDKRRKADKNRDAKLRNKVVQKQRRELDRLRNLKAEAEENERRLAKAEAQKLHPPEKRRFRTPLPSRRKIKLHARSGFSKGLAIFLLFLGLLVLFFLVVGHNNPSTAYSRRDRFLSDNAYGATANAVERIEDDLIVVWVLLIVVLLLTTGTLWLIISRLGDIEHALLSQRNVDTT